MDNFQIETAQNISIEQNVAGIGERILAFVVDLTIIVLYIIVAQFLLSSLKDDDSMFMYYLVLGLPSFLYYLLFETFWNGKTPGKALLQIQVVKLDGTRPAFSNYLVRWLLRIIDISLSSGGIAVVTILFNGKGQRLGDIAAGTTVISERSKMTVDRTMMTEVPNDYIPKYPQVTILTDRDIQEVKELYRKARFDNQEQIINTLSDHLAGVLEVSVDEEPKVFVKRVIDDYNYYTQQ